MDFGTMYKKGVIYLCNMQKELETSEKITI